MTTLDGPEQPADRSARREPREMTEAEKRMAEWEARHDVAARGHRAGPDVLQHYFAHERLTHPEPRAEEVHATPSERPAPRSGRAGTADRPRGWLRRLLRRR
ncbi:hypothetical protein [Geodermatophilus sp. SYSU D01176]